MTVVGALIVSILVAVGVYLLLEYVNGERY